MSDVSSISFKKKIALELHRKYKKNAAQLHELNYIFWECTTECNLKCIACNNHCHYSDRNMPVTDFLKAIDEITGIVTPNKTMISIVGGEPLLRQDLEYCGFELHKKGFPWGIVTNGLLLNENKIKSLLSAGLRSISINLDGLKKSHNWIKNDPTAFQHVIRALKLLKKYSDITYDVVTYINKRNFLELDEIRDILIENQVKSWRIISMTPSNSSKHPDLLLSPIQFKSLFEFIKKTKKERIIQLNYGCQGFLGAYEGEVRENFYFCRAGINIVSILSDGSVTGCPSLNKNFVQGNIYVDNLRDVWENEFKPFRNKNWSKKGDCKSCKWYTYCEGNSIHLYDKNSNLLFCHLKNIKAGQPFV
jgi:radical SAM enzyme (rSAM/lipoprotein system)